jgi:ATP-binding cassette, subfamily B, bacterial PglK
MRIKALEGDNLLPRDSIDKLKYNFRFFLGLKSTKYTEITSLFTKNDKRKFVAVVIIQVLLGMLDLLGVAIIGVLGTIAISGIQSTEPSQKIETLLIWLNMQNLTFQSQVMILAIIAATALVARTLLSVYFTRKILFFLSRRGAWISANLISKLLNRNLDQIQQRSLQENLFGVTYGVSTITVGIIGTTVLIISDLTLIAVMAIGLIVIDPIVAAVTLLGFIATGYLLYTVLHLKALSLGVKNSQASIDANQKITEVLKTYREAVAQNRRQFYVEKIGRIRSDQAETLAEISFMPNISKYVLESTVVIGALLVSGIQFAIQDSTNAVATLAVFLAAGSRMAPSFLRIQQGALTVKTSLGSAKFTLELMSELKNQPMLAIVKLAPSFKHLNFSPSLEVENLTFQYTQAVEPVLKDINISLGAGKVLAIVGPSGSGKTTLVDLILGSLIPTQGEIRISGDAPLKTAADWPGALSYVPQDVVVVNGTVRENVALGYNSDDNFDGQILKCLEIANLTDLLSSLPKGLDAEIGDHGHVLSGGQRQRLGIARAMFTNPRFLVLDEATSALDAETEFKITNSINQLRGRLTLVIIAHRLSTVRNADLVIYLNDGKIEAEGTFDDVRRAVPNFDRQINLLGS